MSLKESLLPYIFVVLLLESVLIFLHLRMWDKITARGKNVVVGKEGSRDQIMDEVVKVSHGVLR